MAKRGRPPGSKNKPRQQLIPGTYDEPSKAVENKGQEYAEAQYQRMALQHDENELKDELVELMQKEGITKFKVDETYEIELKMPDGPPKAKIKCKKLEDDGEEGDGDGVFE